MRETKNGHLILSGSSSSSDIEGITIENRDFFLAIYDKNGNLLLQQNSGNSFISECIDMLITNNENIFLFGYVEPYESYTDIFINKHYVVYDVLASTTENGVSTIEQVGNVGRTKVEEEKMQQIYLESLENINKERGI